MFTWKSNDYSNTSERIFELLQGCRQESRNFVSSIITAIVMLIKIKG